MSRTLTVENETHWRTADILNIIRQALTSAGALASRKTEVLILFGMATNYSFTHHRWGRKIKIWLPKRGPKLTHTNPMIALAAAGIEVGTTLLAVQDSFFLANALYWEFCQECGNTAHLRSSKKHSTNPPSWTQAESLIITKYKDPAKDAGFLALKADCEEKIASAQARVNKWDAEAKKANKLLKRAKKDLNEQTRRLREAKKRRGIT